MRNIRWEPEGNCFGPGGLEPLEGRRLKREQGKVEEGAQLTSDWREGLNGWMGCFGWGFGWGLDGLDGLDGERKWKAGWGWPGG